MSLAIAAIFRSPVNYFVYTTGTEQLVCRFGSVERRFRAFSGGGRGSIAGRAEDSAASFDYRLKKVSDERGERGGPLPPGHYLVHRTEQHGHLGQANWLESITAHLRVPTRDFTKAYGFYIHGRGPKGSDGCIVPENRSDREWVQGAIDRLGLPIPLWVVLGQQPERGDVLKRVMNPYQA